VTFSCYKRLPLLGSAAARDLLVHALGKIRERWKFSLVGYVVMPNHVHLLIGEPEKGTPSTVLKALKQRVSRDLRSNESPSLAAELPARIAGSAHVLPHFWQTRFYDFNVYSAKKQKEKLDYMHFNPVMRGLVKSPEEWRWSSFLFYATGKEGLVPIDPV
jgi:putative transposase